MDDSYTDKRISYLTSQVAELAKCIAELEHKLSKHMESARHLSGSDYSDGDD